MPTAQKVLRVVPFKSAVSRHPYYFNVVARNGEIILASEGYRTKAKRDKTIKLLASSKIVIAK